LAKRKTTIMKELEQEYADRDRLKKLKIARKEARDKHLLLPHALTADSERQLRKIATRGGIFFHPSPSPPPFISLSCRIIQCNRQI
jgi:hypothetical protein